MTDEQLKILGKHLGAMLPGAPGFEERRQVWNSTVDRKPAAIIPVKSASDVQSAINTAVRCGAGVCVRGGGHNIAGLAVADGAVMIDMSAMNRIEVDANLRLGHVGGGATWAGFDAHAQVHGLAAPGGVVSSTGVAGLTLGGGFGWLARRYGLAIDNLISAEIILADGRMVTCSEADHADLFWAIRGGGGNFGVVTKFTFRLHPVGPKVLFGPTFFALDDARTVLTAYAQYAPSLPRGACVWANLMTAPETPALPDDMHGTKVLTLMQFFTGSPDQGYRQLRRLYGGATPLGSALSVRPFTEAQSFLDLAYGFGARNYWRAHNLDRLTAGLIDVLLGLAPELPTPEAELLICQLGGAVADVPRHATAFPHRDVSFIATPSVRWHDKSDDTRVIRWLESASAQIAEHAAPGAYVNFITETDSHMSLAYGGNLDRLVAIKRKYDPQNLFRFNQNIAPQSDAGVTRRQTGQ